MTVQAKPSAFITAFASSLLLLNPLSVLSQCQESTEENTAFQTALAITTAPEEPLDSVVLVANSQQLIALPADEVVSKTVELPTILPAKHHAKVKDFIHRYTLRERSFVADMLQRKHVYFPIYEEQLRKHCLPDELKYLPIIESGLNPRAVSAARAVGQWQFMSATGRQYQLYQDAYIDERMDPYKATDAACRYLKDLYGMFKNWELALAAYNCGPGNVRRAIRRSGNRTSFWQLYPYLPRETRAYVPKFVAIAYIMTHAEHYNLTTDSLILPIPSDTIVINQYLDMQRLATQLDISFQDLRALNPQVKKNVVPAYLKGYSLRIPTEKKDFFTCNRDSILASASLIKRVTPNHVVLIAHAQHFSQVPAGRKIVHQVRSGEVIGSIANRYQVKITDLKRWNRLRGNALQAGQKLVIWKDGKPVLKLAENRAPTVSKIL